MENEERSHHIPLALYPDLYQKLKIGDIVQKSCHDESQRTYAEIRYKYGPEYKEIPTLSRGEILPVRLEKRHLNALKKRQKRIIKISGISVQRTHFNLILLTGNRTIGGVVPNSAFFFSPFWRRKFFSDYTFSKGKN